MIKLSFGEMIKRFRIEKGLKAGQICGGLCANSFFSHLEQEEGVPSPLLFEYLVERMGVSPESFSIMASQEEYEYYEWRKQVLKAIADRNTLELEELLRAGSVDCIYFNEKTQRQFLLYARALYYGIGGEYVQAATILKEAAIQTIPDMNDIRNSKVRFSAIEIHILLLYLYYSVQGKSIDMQYAKRLFDDLETYLSDEMLDLNLRAKIYPKLCCVGNQLFKERMTDTEKELLCEKAVELMVKDMSFHDITNVLHFYIPLLEKHEKDKANFYKKQYETFGDILKSGNTDTGFYVENLNVFSPKIYIVNEYLLYKRQIKGISQEKLSEGICEPETYSRVETGKRSPSRNNMLRIAERLDMDWCFYCGELDTSNLKAFALRVKHREASLDYKSEESLEILSQLEQQLDMSSIMNIQYVRSNQYAAEYRLGRISGEETIEKLKGLLSLTKTNDFQSLPLVCYSQNELEMIAHIAQILRDLEQYEEAIRYIEKTIHQMQGSRVDMKYQWRGMDFVLRVLESLYFKTQKYDVAIRIAEYVQNENVKRKNASNLIETLDEMADCYEHMGERYKDEYKKLYRHTYYVADFYHLQYVKNYMDQYYKERFDPDIKWY